MSNRVRVVGGQYRSRWLRFPNVAGLRPTPDRVRETLFNWLGQDLTDQHCLDLFAGSGALGFEAASRGAASVTLVERHHAAQIALEESRQALSAEQVRIIRGDAFRVLRELPPASFDVVFLDPPFDQGWMPKLLPLVAPLLRPAGVVYAEAAPLPDLSEWTVLRRGKSGLAEHALLQVKAPASPPAAV